MQKHSQRKTGSLRETWPDAWFQMAATCIAAFLCFYAALWMIQDVFPDWKLMHKTHRAVAAVILFTAVIYEVGIRLVPGCRALLRLLVALVYAVVAVEGLKPYRIDFEDGACAFVSQYLEKWNKKMHTDWAIWIGKTEWISFSFSACMVLALLAALCFSMCVCRRAFLLILPSVALCALLLAGYAPGQKGLGLFFAAALFLSAFSGSRRTAIWRYSKKRCNKRKLQMPAVYGVQGRRQIYAKLSRIFVPAGAAAFALAVYVLICAAAPVGGLMEKAPGAFQFQKTTERKLSQAVSAFYTSESAGVNNSTPQYTGREVMRITASQKPLSSLYLKGFCGSDYENGKWVYDEEPFQDACEKSGYHQQDTAKKLLNIPYGLLDESPYEIDRQQIDYTIKYTGIWNRYAYLPYLTDLSGVSDISFWGDGTVQKNWGRRTMRVHGKNRSLGFAISEFTPLEDIPDVSVFYNKFVDKAYRGLPADGNVEDKAGAADGNGNYEAYSQIFEEMSASNEGRILYAQFVCGMLKQNYEYSLNLDPVPEGEDPVEYFLNVSGRGYCVHFASAAVRMLRKFGVPARYVSGYQISARDFRETEEGYVASVKDEDAHAWAEIYLKDTGWIPVDATPSGMRRAAQNSQAGAQGAAGPQQDSSKKDSPQQKKDDEKKPDKEADSKNKEKPGGTYGRKNGLEWIRNILFAVVLILFVGAAAVLLYRLVRIYGSLPKREIEKGMYTAAVCRINRRLYRRLRLRGKGIRPGLTDAAYEKELESAYPAVSGADWARFMAAAKKAVFSENGIGREEASFCYGVYGRVNTWAG